MNTVAELDYFCSKTKGFTSDSRLADNDKIFVALSGATIDGANFIQEVLIKFSGSYAVTENKKVYSELDDSIKDRCLLVSSAHQAHRHIAKNFRIKFSGTVIAVGGSNGKTSTKDFLYQILSSKFNCIKTQASQNGELGIPKTLEQLNSNTQIAIVEVGIDGPGDMIRHAELVRPNFAILTSIGEEHLNLLKSVEGVFREERVLADWCYDYGGQVVVAGADPYLNILVKEGKAIAAKDLNNKFNPPFSQKHFLSNLSLCVEVCRLMQMTEQEIALAVQNLQVPQGRGVLKQKNQNKWFYEDYYNANSSSMKAGIDSAKDIAQAKGVPLRLVLGDMFDLGDQESSVHDQVLKMASESGAETIILIGERFASALNRFENKQRVSDVYISQSEAVKNKDKIFSRPGVYLIKGSRGMRLEALCV